MNEDNTFNDEEMHPYDVVTDYVVWFVLNHADRPLPAWYKKD